MDDVADRLEQTALGPTTAWGDVKTALDTALRDGLWVCLPPWAVSRASEYAPTVSVATVVGFPHGQHTTATKCEEATAAWKAGADRVDVVGNLGMLDDDSFAHDIEEVIAAVPIPVTVIVESPLLDEATLRETCAAVEETGVAAIKTATDFNGPTTISAVEVTSEYLPTIATGGIKSWVSAQDMFAAGATRISSPRAGEILDDARQSE